MPFGSHIADQIASPVVRTFGNDPFAVRSHTRPMRNHLRAWRETNEMTQEELADKVGTSKSVISDLENEKRGLSDKWLRRLAPIFGITPGHLLDHAPGDVDAEVLDLWSNISERDRAQAMRVLRSFVRTGTDD